MNHPPELKFDSPLDFRMLLEATEDGERIVRQRDEQAADRARMEQMQRTFFGELARKQGVEPGEL